MDRDMVEYDSESSLSSPPSDMILDYEDDEDELFPEMPDLLDRISLITEDMRQISRHILVKIRKAPTPSKPPTKSPFFQNLVERTVLSHASKHVKNELSKRQIVTCIPLPPLSMPSFGLIQEKLYTDPFRLLIAVTLLNRTRGKHSIPVFYQLTDRYPTPQNFLDADRNDIVEMQHHLGFQSQRADTYQKYARFWINEPPEKGKRYRVGHYPHPGDGMDVRKGEVLDDEDPRSAWEIGHITQGRYAIDSWRIFCRDILRGVAEGWNGEGATEEGFQPEWMRVRPTDKELIAHLRWMWLKEGFLWDPVTGEKEVAGREVLDAVNSGRMVYDNLGGMRILENDDDEEALDTAPDEDMVDEV
jgi:endonuclease III